MSQDIFVPCNQRDTFCSKNRFSLCVKLFDSDQQAFSSHWEAGYPDASEFLWIILVTGLWLTM